jgi:predicted ABC-type ATPase
VILVIIHIDPPELNIARVNQRVIDGGHAVPEEKIRSRIPRVLDNVAKAIPLCDDVRVRDNSNLNTPFQSVLTIKNGIITHKQQPLPAWPTDSCLKLKGHRTGPHHQRLMTIDHERF